MEARTHRNYLLAVLMVVYAFNAVDGLVLGLVLQDIKTDLHLSDTQLGLLTGIAFALFYSVMGIPIARWADRGNRVSIIAITTALWSAAVVLCGRVTGFSQLMLVRMGVAVGEAGCIPPAQSLIADFFNRAERPRAVATYMMGAPLSVVIGYFVAGWLNQFYGWRATFTLLGIPGLLVAGLVKLTLKDPRGETPVNAAVSETEPSLSETWRTLWANRTFRHLLFAFSVACFFANGISQWQPAFFTRSYGLKTGELGTWFTLIYGLGGVIGIYSGGALASRLAANNEALQLKSMGVLYTTFGLVSALIYLAPNPYMAFGLMGVAFVGGAATSGPLFATIQSLVPERMRATSVALIYLFANLIGMGLGPLAAGSLSDALRPWAGEESLRYALLALSPGYLWVSWHLWHASKTVKRDMRVTRASDSEPNLLANA